MVNADIHFPDSINFKVELIEVSDSVTGEVACLRLKTDSGFISMHLFHECQIDAIVDCLLTHKANKLSEGIQGGPIC